MKYVEKNLENVTIKETWPKQHGYKTLLEWFDVEIHSMVVDSVIDDEYSSFLFEDEQGF